jgi:hypothetical protein
VADPQGKYPLPDAAAFPLFDPLKAPRDGGQPMLLLQVDYDLSRMLDVGTSLDAYNSYEAWDQSGVKFHYSNIPRPYAAGVLTIAALGFEIVKVPSPAPSQIVEHAVRADQASGMLGGPRDGDDSGVVLFAATGKTGASGQALALGLWRADGTAHVLDWQVRFDLPQNPGMFASMHSGLRVPLERGERPTGREVRFRHDDVLQLQCRFTPPHTTDSHFSDVRGGLDNQDERCVGYVWYYPAERLRQATFAQPPLTSTALAPQRPDPASGSPVLWDQKRRQGEFVDYVGSML